MMCTGPLTYLLQSHFDLPIGFLFLSVIGAFGGGVVQLLPILFAMRSDFCTPTQRDAAFLRLELSLFVGLFAGSVLASKLLDSNAGALEALELEKRVFRITMALAIFN